jgi:hypothetical protein
LAPRSARIQRMRLPENGDVRKGIPLAFLGLDLAGHVPTERVKLGVGRQAVLRVYIGGVDARCLADAGRVSATALPELLEVDAEVQCMKQAHRGLVSPLARVVKRQHHG